MSEDRRKHLVALKPCGCMGIIFTVEDPDERRVPARDGKPEAVLPPYKADAAMMADFWKSVHKANTGKKPVQLEVKEITGRPDIPWGCPQCTPPKQGGLFDGQ